MTVASPRARRAVLVLRLLLPVLAGSTCFVASALVASPASAANGSITPATKLLPETTGGWKMNLTVKLPKKPDPAYQSFRFFFTPIVLYETYMDDTKPGEQTRLLPQDKNTKPQVESLEVGFSDARNEVWDTTKFDFVIKRDRGFEAGEYKVEVRDTQDRVIGSSFVVKLDGKNPVVDRRAMVMSGTPRKKEAPKADAPSGAAAAPADGPVTPDSAMPPEAKADGPAAAPPAAKKGCSVSSTPGVEGGDWLAFGSSALALTLLSARRRRGFASRLGTR